MKTYVFLWHLDVLWNIDFASLIFRFSPWLVGLFGRV